MIRRALCLLGVLLVLAGCASLREPSPRAMNFPPLEFQVPEVDRLQVGNGIRLYLMEDHELPLIEITAMVGAGGIGIPADREGMAGIFGTLLRTGGAGNLSPAAFDATLERMAADLSAGTETYVTSLNLSLRAQDLDEGLELLSAVLRRPRFDPQRLEVARKQALETIRRQFDEPGPIAFRTLMKAIYGDHPLGRYPTEKTVQAISRDDLVAFHRRYFHPGNLWLAVSGDFDRSALLLALEKAFGDWPSAAFEPQQIPPVPDRPASELLLAVKEIPQTTVMMGELGIDKSAPDLYAVRVLDYILGGGGFNSRLMREIRSNRGLAYSAYSQFQVGRRLPGPFLAGTETKSSSTLEVVRLIRSILADLRSRPVSQEELELARESQINSFVFAFTDSHAIVAQTMRLDYYDYPPDYLQKYRQRVAAVTAADVLEAARRHLDLDRLKIVLVGDPATFDGDPASLGLPVTEVSRKP